MTSLFHGKAVILSGFILCALSNPALADTGLIPSSQETTPSGSSARRTADANQHNNSLIQNRQEVADLSGQVSAMSVMTDSRGHLPGDVDLDGDVDLADYQILIANIHTDKNLHQEADVNDDGKIDFYDFRLLKTNFGKSLDPNQLPLEKINAISGASNLIYGTFTGLAVVGDYLLATNALDGGSPSEGSITLINANPLSPDYLQRNNNIFFRNPASQQTGSMFGFQITGFGNNFFISAPSEDFGALQNRGAVYLFNPFSGLPVRKFISPHSDGGSFGESIAVKDNLLFVGEKYVSHNGQTNTGAVHVFNADINSPGFGSLIRTIYNNAAGQNTQYYFGESIAIVGNYLVSTTVDYSQNSNGNLSIKLVNLSNPNIIIDIPNVPLSDDTIGLGSNSGALQITGVGKDIVVSYGLSDALGMNNGIAHLIDTTPGSATFGQILTTFKPPVDAPSGMGFGASLAVMGSKVVISGSKGDTFVFEANRSSQHFGDLVQSIYVDPRRPNFAFYYNQLAVRGDRLYITAPNAAEFNDKASNIHVFKATSHFGGTGSQRTSGRITTKSVSGISKALSSDESINALRLDSLRKKQKIEELTSQKTKRPARR